VRPTSARTAFATLAVVITAVAAFALVTDGFTVLTTEAARRAFVLRSPIAVPDLQGTDQIGRVHGMLADPEHAGSVPRVTIVEFVYTRCETICSAQASSYQQLQHEIRARHLQGKVRLLTVSFDPSHDTPVTLAKYAQRMHADPSIWTLISPTRSEQVQRALAAFGVVVIPAPLGQFQHNAAFHVLDGRGWLVRIVDADNPLGALDAAVSLSQALGSLV
jgi:protein SCO1